MKKSTAFLFMDFYTLKPYSKSVALIAAIGVFMGFLLKSAMFPVLMFMICVVLCSSYPFAVAEKNEMDTLYSVLPVKRSDVVVGRYLFLFAFALAGFALSFLLSIIISAVYGSDVTAGQTAAQCLIFSSAALIMVSLQYPIYFLVGYSKAKLAAMLPLLVFSVGIALVTTIVPDSVEKLVGSLDGSLVTIILPLVAAVLLLLSGYISCKLYAKRDL